MIEAKKKKILVVFINFIIGEVVSTAFNLLFIKPLGDMNIREIILGILGVGAIIGIILTVFYFAWLYIIYINKSIKKANVFKKYLLIMLVKFQDSNPSHPDNVFDNDLALFSEKEKEYFKELFNDIKQTKILLKGTNKTLGRFTN